MGDIPGLAKSIFELGLLQPIVITKDHKLVAGGRRLEAFKVLAEEDSRFSSIPATIVDLDEAGQLQGEHDENECRKPFTPSEKVAIMRAIEEHLKVAKFCHGRTKESAATQAGFGNRETARQAEQVVDRGVPELVDAVDDGTISISDAAGIVDAEPEEQREAVDSVRKGEAPTARAALGKNRDAAKALAYKSISALIRACDELKVTSATVKMGSVRDALDQIKHCVGSASGAS
jgi:ParB family chromosome partitioning protein